MIRKLTSLLVIVVLALASLTACASEPQALGIEQAEGATQSSTTTPSEKSASTSPGEESSAISTNALSCGQVYQDGDLSFNILRVKETSDGGERFLLVKMEVFNGGSSDMKFSSLLSLELTDEGAKKTFSLSPFAKTDGNLDGTILPKNKLIGEVAFEIEESKENEFVLHIGQTFDYKPAFLIRGKDIGSSFNEAFESEGVKSDYTLGVPVEMEDFTLLVYSASREDSQKEGLDLLICELDLTNKGDESQPFFLGFHYDFYSSDGMKLKMYSGLFDFPSEVEGNSTVGGIASFYFEKGKTDFYITVTPKLGNQSNTEVIAFSLEPPKETTEIRKMPKYDEFEEQLLVPNYPLDLLPLYPSAKVIDSMYDYRGGTNEISKHTITADLVIQASSFEDAMAHYDGFGLSKEINITNNGDTEETNFSGQLNDYQVEIVLLRFLEGDGDSFVSIRLSY